MIFKLKLKSANIMELGISNDANSNKHSNSNKTNIYKNSLETNLNTQGNSNSTLNSLPTANKVSTIENVNYEKLFTKIMELKYESEKSFELLMNFYNKNVSSNNNKNDKNDKNNKNNRNSNNFRPTDILNFLYQIEENKKIINKSK